MSTKPKYFRVRKRMVRYKTVLIEADSAEEAAERAQKHAWAGREDLHARESPAECESTEVLAELDTLAPQYSYDDISDASAWDKKTPWHFASCVASDIEAIGGPCIDNNEVTDLLRRKRVVTKANQTDPESSCFYAYFKTQQQGHRFIDRLNKFLRTKHDQLQQLEW